MHYWTPSAAPIWCCLQQYDLKRYILKYFPSKNIFQEVISRMSFDWWPYISSCMLKNYRCSVRLFEKYSKEGSDDPSAMINCLEAEGIPVTHWMCVSFIKYISLCSRYFPPCITSRKCYDKVSGADKTNILKCYIYSSGSYVPIVPTYFPINHPSIIS